MKVFVTGGAGYIGSHCCKAFAKKGWDVVVYDNLSRGDRQAVRWGEFIEGDVLDRQNLLLSVSKVRPDLLAHFAACTSATQSLVNPAKYYLNNSVGTLNVLDAMLEAKTSRLLFSSTSAVYGESSAAAIDETHYCCPVSAYGRSKYAAELMIQDYCTAYELRCVILRYFNAAGFDLGLHVAMERPAEEMPAVQLAVAAAMGGAPFEIFGTDFPTRDGSAIRDYVHVSDLAAAHVLGADFTVKSPGTNVFNLGTQRGLSVIELLDAVSRVTGAPVPKRNSDRRLGEPAIVVASAAKAEQILGWRPLQSDIDEIVRSTLAWRRSASRNSQGAILP